MPIVKSPSKLNLFLEVTEKRLDGYHSIDSIFVCINLCDDMEIEWIPDNHIEVTTDHPLVPDGLSNIIYKAIAAVKDSFAIQSGVRVHVRKKIPVGGGLGGGSSNAATILKTICERWNIDLNHPELQQIAVRIGADVPFFLNSSGFARCTGIGEIIEDISLNQRLWFVLVNPQIHIDTGKIYKKIRLTYTGKRPIILYRGISHCTVGVIASGFFNRMEEVVIPMYPVVGDIKNELNAHGCVRSLMSGSGSTVFGLAKDKQSAETIADALRDRYPQWFVTATHSSDNITIGG